MAQVASRGSAGGSTVEPAPAGSGSDPVDIGAAGTVVAMGARIRKLRNERQFTLQTLSARTGLSASMLSMVERGRTSPSIGTLVAIASALRVHMSELFDIEPEDDPSDPVHRVADQPVFETAAGVTRRLAQNDNVRGLELVANEYQPGTASSATPVHHEGIEYGIVLDGVLTIEIDAEVHELRAGDSITYESAVPHRIVNNGKRPARAIWVNLDR